jgi:hypothetical protein
MQFDSYFLQTLTGQTKNRLLTVRKHAAIFGGQTSIQNANPY